MLLMNVLLLVVKYVHKRLMTQEDQVVEFYGQVIQDLGNLDYTIKNAEILRANLLVKVKDDKVKGFL